MFLHLLLFHVVLLAENSTHRVANKMSRTGCWARAALCHLSNNVEGVTAKICHDLVRRYLRNNLLREAVPVCWHHRHSPQNGEHRMGTRTKVERAESVTKRSTATLEIPCDTTALVFLIAYHSTNDAYHSTNDVCFWVMATTVNVTNVSYTF